MFDRKLYESKNKGFISGSRAFSWHVEATNFGKSEEEVYRDRVDIDSSFQILEPGNPMGFLHSAFMWCTGRVCKELSELKELELLMEELQNYRKAIYEAIEVRDSYPEMPQEKPES